MRQYVIASVLIILGLGLFVLRTIIPIGIANEVLGNLASAILVSGLLSLLFKIFQDKEAKSELLRLFRIHDSVDNLGLVEIKTGSQSYDFTELIENSDSLNIVMNDGQRWIGNNSVAFEKRFSEETETIFFSC